MDNKEELLDLIKKSIHIEISSSLPKTERTNKGKSLTTFVDDYTLVDLETTGLSPSDDDIIEIAAIKVRNNEVIDTYQQLINPGYDIDDFVSDLTGITNKMLADSPSINEKIDDFINFVSDDIIVGHNVNFDINFIYDNLLKIKNNFFTNNFIDTMRFSRKLFKDKKHHRLLDLVDLYNIDINESHRALADCNTTFMVYNNLKKTALQQFESVDNFSKSFCSSHDYYSKIRNIKATTAEFDEMHPLYNKVCVFTGALEKLVRTEAAQLVVNFGGTVENSVTKRTNILILGNNDYCKSIKDGKSSKQKRAEQLIKNGSDLIILSENTFYDMVFNGGN